MKVAIPEHQGRIAPVFDCCRRVLVIVHAAETDERVADEDWSGLPRVARPGRLMQLTVDLLICGGISCWMEDQIQQAGIRVIPWIAGGVGEVLTALRQGTICDACYLMPGRGRCRRGRRLEKVPENNAQAENSFQKGA
jgi:predicted Fe-Mo cluster-binding NifX family protein